MSQAGLLPVELVLPPDVPLTFTGNAGSGSAVANNFNIEGAGAVSTSVVGDTLTISVASTAFSWTVVTSADNPVTLVTNNGYIAKGAGVVNFILPAAAAVGDTYKIVGYGNLWTLAQNAGQNITIGFVSSTVGVGGSVAASMISDNLTLVCVTNNTEFYEQGVQGNLIVI